MSDKYQQHVEKVQAEINEVSPSFCIAKWKQVTMHLQNGQTHSCHHPNTHTIPIEEIARNPSALHNTEYKKQQRKMMLEGQRPPECDYCWRVEDAGKISDRAFKSADHWAYPYKDDIVNKPWHDNVDPSYVEVSFSSVCNFKCSYCAPHISSQWMEEIERLGPYPTSTKFNNIQWLKNEGKMPIPNREDNPYVDAFWAWWPTMYTQLKNFRITGGEPLLSKNTFKVLDYIIENPNPDLVLGINTNLCVPVEVMNKFIEKMKQIQSKGMIKSFVLYTSAEAHGAQSEYIRHGMDYQQWLKNIERVLSEIPVAAVSLMSTYNLMSLLSYTEFLDDIYQIRFKYRGLQPRIGRPAVTLDIPYLRDPKHQAVYIMEPELIHYVDQQIKFMEDRIESPANGYAGFKEVEIYKLRRIRSVIQEELANPKDLDRLRKDFVIFVDEHDVRRGTNFLQTFPGFKDMYAKWKNL